MSCHILFENSFPVKERGLLNLNLCEPGLARNLNVHLIPGDSYLINLDWSLGSTWQRKGRKKKKVRERRLKGKVKLRSEGREEEGGSWRGRGRESQSSEHSKPCSANVSYLFCSFSAEQRLQVP